MLTSPHLIPTSTPTVGLLGLSQLGCNPLMLSVLFRVVAAETSPVQLWSALHFFNIQVQTQPAVFLTTNSPACMKCEVRMQEVSHNQRWICVLILQMPFIAMSNISLHTQWLSWLHVWKLSQTIYFKHSSIRMCFHVQLMKWRSLFSWSFSCAIWWKLW